MQNLIHNAARRSRRRRGFGLLETMIAMSLMSLLFLGAMDMILNSARSTVRTQAQVYSTAEAANAIQNVIGQLREASDFSLPTSTVAGQPEDNWKGVDTIPMSSLSTTLDGETINTAIEIMSPAVLTPTSNDYTQPVQYLNVLATTTGNYWQAGLAGSPLAAQYDVRQKGGLGISTMTLIYRGDPDGTPDSTAGTYLWQYTLPTPGGAFSLANPRTALCKTVATAPNAVQFVRPSYAVLNQPDVKQVEVKIISSNYSAINGQQTNEEGSGASSSALTGKCVYMRDHFIGGHAIPAHTGSRTGNDAFHFH